MCTWGSKEINEIRSEYDYGTYLLRQIDEILEACGAIVKQHLEDGLLSPLLGKGPYKIRRILIQLSGLLIHQGRQADAFAEATKG